MVYTAPRTWVSGEVVPATLLNTHLRDNLKAISDPLGSYTPTWTATTTNPSIGNGSLAGNYAQVGKWVRFRIDLTFGTTTSAGSGTWFFSLPVAALQPVGPIGSAVCLDSSPGITYPRLAFSVASTSITVSDMVPNRLSGTVPFGWSSTDELHISGWYEAA